MSIKRTLLLYDLGLCVHVGAQTGMTDNQVMQYMIKETERGTPRQEIVTNLIERGVSIEQIRRIKKKIRKTKRRKCYWCPRHQRFKGKPPGFKQW